MKGRIFICANFFVFCAVSAFANDAVITATQNEVKVVNKIDRTEVQLTQQAERLEPRNRISVRLTVEARGNNAKEIQKQINDRMAAAVNKAKEITAITVETSSYSVSRPYDSENSKDSDRWRGTQTLVMTSDDFEAVLRMSGLLQADGLVMSDMKFFVAPETLKATQDELTTIALQRLKERTDHVAGDLNLKVERYKNITIGNASEEYGDSGQRASKAISSTPEKNSTPSIASGYSLITLRVNATVIMSQ